jgi:hypothetical protein
MPTPGSTESWCQIWINRKSGTEILEQEQRIHGVKGEEAQAAVLPGSRLFQFPDAFYTVSDKNNPSESIRHDELLPAVECFKLFRPHIASLKVCPHHAFGA